MDQGELFSCCRSGDLPRIKYLVEHKEVELNVRDKWDSTPLYYACLCGHMDVVEYLLQNGARCEANTFDGERCLYGALNSQIRNLLKNYKVVTSKTLKRHGFDEFLRRCFETGEYHDVCFKVHGEHFYAHRCILSTRCEYFKEAFCGRWRHRKIIYINNPLVKVAAFRAVLQYLYTGSLEVQFDDVDDCVILAKQCGLSGLIDEITESVRKIKLFEFSKPGTSITTLVVEPHSHMMELQQDFGVLAEQCLPPQLRSWVGGSELPFLPSLQQLDFSDVCIRVEDKEFLGHKVFFCGRSDFFKALLADHFDESTKVAETDIPLITLHDISTDMFIPIVYYIYQNAAEIFPSDAFDILCAADMYLLPGLKRLCANVIGHQLDVSNVVNFVKVARLYCLPRLEDRCAEFIAKHIEQVVGQEDFQELVISDARDVHHRQETDTISIIDDTRYHVTSNVQTFSAMQDANEKLEVIDKLLEKLGLDA